MQDFPRRSDEFTRKAVLSSSGKLLSCSPSLLSRAVTFSSGTPHSHGGGLVYPEENPTVFNLEGISKCVCVGGRGKGARKGGQAGPKRPTVLREALTNFLRN